ncbi:hypothetical protein [Burkholderia ubonensis]|uniref:hypothetical protein n=1 Tax=Burkholderia ubonensis TaxID=101571 RepID=UPI000A911FE2|nr:hypothetical protein [Burkholderia ubonensis]
MQVASIVVEGRVCRDMYDEHPGFAYFYVDGRRQLPIRKPLPMPEAMAVAEDAWRQLRVESTSEDADDEYDGQFSASRILLLASDGAVLQCLDEAGWVTEFDAPDQWPALLSQASELDAEASFEAGWDNFSTAEGLRARATNLRRRVSMSKAHFGVLPVSKPRAVSAVRRMRGLDERCSLALARIACITDPEQGAADLMAVEMEAEALGMREYRQGIEEPPVMFADEPVLLTAWEAGQDSAAEMAEMENCSACSDPALPLCPFHG